MRFQVASSSWKAVPSLCGIVSELGCRLMNDRIKDSKV